MVALVVGVAVIVAVGAVTAYAALNDDTTPPVTTSDAVSTCYNQAVVHLTAGDASGVAYIYSRVDREVIRLTRFNDTNPAQAGVDVTVPGPAAGSATHTFSFWAQDAAGNVEALHTVTITIVHDTTAPTTSASGVSGGAWYNHALTVSLAAGDEADGSGVSTITSTLDGGAPVVVNATTASVDIAVDVVAHANDGAHTLTYQAADVAGNVESLQSLTVNVDTVRPAPQAPYAASAARGRTATLKYKVVDAAPNAGTATAVIKVKNSAGKVVKTLNVGNVVANVLLPKKFTVPRTWKAGTYRFFVYATDAAGNVQLKAASNKLVVK